MSWATQIYFSGFDSSFYKLPQDLQRRIEAKIDDMGKHLDSFPHYRMTGNNRFRFRVGDYRVIYQFDTAKQEIYLLAIGHRREIYR